MFVSICIDIWRRCSGPKLLLWYEHQQLWRKAGDFHCILQFLLLEMCWPHIEPKLTIIVLSNYNLLYHNSKWKYKKRNLKWWTCFQLYIYLWHIVCSYDIVKFQLVMLQWNIYCIMYYLTWVLYHNLDMKYTKGNFKWWTCFPVI